MKRTEVKSVTLAMGFDFIELEKFTNKPDEIKVTCVDTGKEFMQWTLTPYGNLRIESGVIDYKKYENPYSIKMEVEYEPSPLPMQLEAINTLEGLKRNIFDLASLDYIGTLRLVANRKFDIRLDEFVLFNTLLFDTFGQTMAISYEKMEKYDYQMDKFMSFDDFKRKIPSFSYGAGSIPHTDSVCPHCKQNWTLENLRDCISSDDSLYHLDCNKFSLYEKAKKQFDFIASTVFPDYSIRAVKNEYGSESYRGPWFIINTPDGDVKIGWRKRVINIQWLPNYKKFSFNGKEEDVTKCFNSERYIHAWNREKAIDYLREAQQTFTK